MPRIRSIKPDFFKSEDVAALPLRARLLWIGLWTQCDDHGRYKDSVRLLKGDVWPLDDVSLRDIEEDLSTLEQQRRLVRYEVDGKNYLAVVNWHAHQAINRPGRAKHPAPPKPLGSSDKDSPAFCSTGECTSVNRHARLSESSVSNQPVDNPVDEVMAGQARRESSVSTHGRLTEDSRQERKGGERKGGDVRAGASASPHAPGVPSFLPPEDPDNVPDTGHQGLREGPAGTEPGQLDPVRTTSPPPDRCERHVDSVKPPDCGRCADARKARDRWEADRAERERRMPRCRRHRGQPAHNCALCRSEALGAEP